MYKILLIALLLLSHNASGQIDSSGIERILMTMPTSANKDVINEDIIRAIEAVDKKYRQIADTLYAYRSLKHTILQPVLIKANDSLFIDPLSFGSNIHFTNIIFNNSSLNIKADSLSKGLNAVEKERLFKYLESHFDNFSSIDKKFSAQPARIRYVKFPDDKFIQVGIDIYGTHFLWTIDKKQSWDVIKVENLWVY